MNIPLFDLTRQYQDIKKDVLESLDNIFSSGKVILGENVKKLESDLSKKIESKYACGVANGSDALLIALHALDIKNGDYVITTPFTFFATASSITRNNATPIFVDVEEKYYNIDLEKVETILKTHPEKEKIKAIIPVHLFGKTLDMEKLKYLKNKYNIKIIEDCAQSIGSIWKSKDGNKIYSGTVGDFGTTSFFPTKNLGGYGDGGMIFTQEENLQKRVKKLRVHGAAKKYFHDEIGYNSRLDEVQAAILNIKLNMLDEFTEKRIEKAKRYDQLFKDLNLTDKIIYPDYINDKTHVYHQYVITLKKGNRNELAQYLSKNGIGNSKYYPECLHRQKCFEYLGYKTGDFPIAEKATENTIAIPIFPELTDEEQEYIVNKIKEFYN
ncbi:dTDP-4-amino-4,6-dideoxygalactose transaminase [Oceanotoga teriensis]|jgi:dTDP-4-amino-4,6-dideoxygalactose transaminase|uniref:dTDP-4-amino-4,6-dideoxygalactose transaminase n=1 Tax=Oceanotoga teriensis TaxID=515440 RepID=A0AA45C7R4_9BACT|nr:DegT/DnrJ/EryC1/StrS family aminotransferase [Oceanotoga teriensis]PWJ95476.1 dTDP-4-amino-4,6-dideoxygalactose transaminase [Oceanotoga teriensis]